MVLKDVALNDVDWVELAKDRDTLRALVNTVLLFSENVLTVFSGSAVLGN
jgi:hypothetical protein